MVRTVLSKELVSLVFLPLKAISPFSFGPLEVSETDGVAHFGSRIHHLGNEFSPETWRTASAASWCGTANVCFAVNLKLAAVSQAKPRPVESSGVIVGYPGLLRWGKFPSPLRSFTSDDRFKSYNYWGVPVWMNSVSWGCWCIRDPAGPLSSVRAHQRQTFPEGPGFMCCCRTLSLWCLLLLVSRMLISWKVVQMAQQQTWT